MRDVKVSLIFAALRLEPLHLCEQSGAESLGYLAGGFDKRDKSAFSVPLSLLAGFNFRMLSPNDLLKWFAGSIGVGYIRQFAY
jgi:hypothetical protein